MQEGSGTLWFEACEWKRKWKETCKRNLKITVYPENPDCVVSKGKNYEVCRNQQDQLTQSNKCSIKPCFAFLTKYSLPALITTLRLSK